MPDAAGQLAAFTGEADNSVLAEYVVSMSRVEVEDFLEESFGDAEAAIQQVLEDSLGRDALTDPRAAAYVVMSLLEAVVARVGLARDAAERDALYAELMRGIVHVIWSQLDEETRARIDELRPA